MNAQRPEQTQHDFLLISIGGVAAQAAHAGALMRNLGISLDELMCRVFWLGIDTDHLPTWEPDPDLPGEDQVVVRYVRTADETGRSRAKEYLARQVPKCLKQFIADGLLPESLEPRHLSHRLVNDVEQSEASKNPLKGFLFLVANVSHVFEALRELKTMMTAQNRTICVVMSPSSGTASGGWMLTLALAMSLFPNTPPILVCVMPSRLEGRDEHVQRNYAIFGWNGLLLERVVRHGLVADWKIPVLGGSPIHIRVAARQPAATYLIGARRRTGSVHLESTDEVIDIAGRFLTLMMVGRGQGRGLPSAHSHLLNLTTDALLDEAEEVAEVRVGAAGPAYTDGHPDHGDPAQLRLPGFAPIDRLLRPTRRFAAPGLFTITFKAGLAAEVTRLGVRRAVERVLLATTTDAREHARMFRAWPKERVAGYVRDRWFDIPERAWAHRTEEGTELLEAIDDEVADFATGMRELVEVWESERLLHEELWKRIQNTNPGSLPELANVLRNLSIDERQVLDALASLSDAPDSIDPHETLTDALQRIVDGYRKQAQLATLNLRRLQQPAPAGRLDLLRATILEARLRATVLEVTATHLLPLLNRVREEYAAWLDRLVSRLEAAEATDAEAFARHERVLRDKSYLRRDNYELAFGLAADRIARYATRAEELARDWLGSLDSRPDETLPDGEAVRRSLDRQVAAMEGITDFPSDAASVLRMLASHADLLRIALDRGRALVKLQGERYETRWSVSHSAADSAEIQLTCRDLQAAIRRALPAEQVAVTVNDGRLPLREEGDVLVVLQEQVVDFSIRETISDESFEVYVAAENRLSAGAGLSVHRLHERLMCPVAASSGVPSHRNGARNGGERFDWVAS